MKCFLLRTAVIGFLAVLLLAGTGNASPQTSLLHGLFYNANELFKKGEYAAAAGEYEKILGYNAESGNVYYNLGNAYFKMGKLGKAIVNYERARRLIPRDSDCGANLAYALSLRENPLQEQKLSWILGVPYVVSGYYTLDELTFLAAWLYVIGVFLLMSGILWKRSVAFIKYIVILDGVCLCLAAAAWGIKLWDVQVNRCAVVITASTDAKFAPADTAVTYFKLYEGTRINLVGSNDQWLRIKTPDAKLGWVKKETLEQI